MWFLMFWFGTRLWISYAQEYIPEIEVNVFEKRNEVKCSGDPVNLLPNTPFRVYINYTQKLYHLRCYEKGDINAVVADKFHILTSTDRAGYISKENPGVRHLQDWYLECTFYAKNCNKTQLNSCFTFDTHWYQVKNVTCYFLVHVLSPQDSRSILTGSLSVDGKSFDMVGQNVRRKLYVKEAQPLNFFCNKTVGDYTGITYISRNRSSISTMQQPINSVEFYMKVTADANNDTFLTCKITDKNNMKTNYIELHLIVDKYPANTAGIWKMEETRTIRNNINLTSATPNKEHHEYSTTIIPTTTNKPRQERKFLNKQKKTKQKTTIRPQKKKHSHHHKPLATKAPAKTISQSVHQNSTHTPSISMSDITTPPVRPVTVQPKGSEIGTDFADTSAIDSGPHNSSNTPSQQTWSPLYTGIVVVGIAVVLLAIVLLWNLLENKKRKLMQQQTNATDINYQSLPQHKEGEMPMPVQWTSQIVYPVPENASNIQDLYSNPVPKSQRGLKLEPTYDEVQDSITCDNAYASVQNLPMMTINEPTYAEVGNYESTSAEINRKEANSDLYQNCGQARQPGNETTYAEIGQSKPKEPFRAISPRNRNDAEIMQPEHNYENLQKLYNINDTLYANFTQK